MKRLVIAIFMLVLAGCIQPLEEGRSFEYREFIGRINLPEPSLDGKKSLEKTLAERRSIREYSGEPLTIRELSQLLWSAQGITDPRDFRTAPLRAPFTPLKFT